MPRCSYKYQIQKFLTRYSYRKSIEMEALAFATVSLLVILLLPVSFATYLIPKGFLQCLDNHSLLSYPISSVTYTPNHSSYHSVLQAYIRNLRFNKPTTPKPLLILTPTHESQIQTAIFCARNYGLQMKIRSGGHDFESISSWSEVPFFILDMFNFRSIHVSIEDETAWVQAGATLGELFYRIAEKSNIHGFPAGVCPTVGVGGHFSGGGYGNMMRKYGLSVDNIVDAQIIDVNGRLLDRESMGEELFWAITGGGGSSFGVVLAYKIKLVPVPAKVTVFNVERTLEENATDLVYKWQQIAHKLDEDIFIRLIIDVVNGSRSGEKTIRTSFITLFLGDSEKLLSHMKQSFPELGLQRNDCTEMTWIESVLYYARIPTGTPMDVLLSRTYGLLAHQKRKSDYLKEPIPKEGLEYIWKRMIELERPILTFNPYGGRMAKISPSSKPIPHRAGNICKIQYAANWDDDGVEAENHYLNLLRMLYNYMTPFVSKFPRQAYLNYRDLDLGINHNGPNSYTEAEAYGIKYFLGNYDRLVQIKTIVDPYNFFKDQQSLPILPSTGSCTKYSESWMEELTTQLGLDGSISE